jgi:DNA-binding beta-propeller fold protein YncE/dienelactone hydrolase
MRQKTLKNCAGIALSVLLPALAHAASADTKARFLKMIDRPRVPLAAVVQEVPSSDGLYQANFTFMAEQGERVPGILIRQTAPGARPVVVALHGTGGSKDQQVPLLKQVAARGFTAIAIDGRYHGGRTQSGKGSAEYADAMLRTYRTGQGHPFLYDTVWDIMRLIDFLETRPDVDAKRIGLIGFSKGGMETYLAAAVDPRIAVAVPCIGVQSFRWALDNDSWQSRVGTFQKAIEGAAKDAGVEKIDAKFVRAFYDKVAPGVYTEFDGPAMVPLIAPRPLLSINGEIDPRTPGPGLQECVRAAEAAYAAAGAPDHFALHIQKNTAHQVKPEALALGIDWLAKWLRAPPMPATASVSTVTIAGTGVAGFSGDGGDGTQAQVNNPYGLVVGPDGALYFCEIGTHRIRRLDLRTHKISTVVGTGQKGYTGNGGPALQANLNEPYEIRFDSAGNMFFAEMQNHVVRRVDAKTGIITTVAGTGVPGFSGDGGPANQAQLRQPHSITFDAQGRLLICDIGNQRIRRVDLKTGTIETWAGTGEGKPTPDGATLASAPLNGPRALTSGPDGNLYLVLRGGNAVYRIDPKEGRIYHLAGTGETGNSGDGGPAKEAKFNGPKGIAWAPDNSLYLADTENHTIRRIDLQSGNITTVVGTGKRGDGPDGNARECALSRPHGIFVNSDGKVYIADSESHRVRTLK